MRSPRLNDSKGLEETATEKFSKKGKPRAKESKKGKGEHEGTKSRVQQFKDPGDEFEQRGGEDAPRGKKKKKKRVPHEETKTKDHFLAVPGAPKGKHNEEMEVDQDVLHTKRKSMGSPLDTSTAPLKEEDHKWEADESGKKKKKLRKRPPRSEEEAGEGEKLNEQDTDTGESSDSSSSSASEKELSEEQKQQEEETFKLFSLIKVRGPAYPSAGQPCAQLVLRVEHPVPAARPSDAAVHERVPHLVYVRRLLQQHQGPARDPQLRKRPRELPCSRAQRACLP